MRFDAFLDRALYGPDGFYAGPGRAGRRGDFLTSPEVGPLFGAVVARAVDQWWRDAGEPASFTFVDAGAGPGSLVRAVRAAEPESFRAGALRFVTVEAGAAQRAVHPEWVEARAELPEGPLAGVVVANELLDNVPFRLLVSDGGWREAEAIEEPGGWVERLAPFSDPLPSWLPARVPHGSRVPLQERAGAWVADVVGRLDGRLVVIDYARARTAELAVRPWRDWLRTYRAHDRGVHYLRDVGLQDVTADVCIDQLVAAAGEPDAVRTQAQFLLRWGIDELVEDGRRIWAEQAARPGIAALAARSRIREAEALLDPDGLGGFSVLEWVGALTGVRSTGR